MIKGMHTMWGSHANVLDPIKDTPGSLAEAILFFDYLIVWSLVMAAYIAMFVLAGVATSLLVLVWVPCFLWSKVLPKGKSLRAGHGPKARLVG